MLLQTRRYKRSAGLLTAIAPRLTTCVSIMDNAFDTIDRAAENVAIQEEERAERLVLCRGAHLFLHSQVRQKGGDLGVAHLHGMALPVEQDEPADPANVGFFSPQARPAKNGAISDVLWCSSRMVEVSATQNARASIKYCDPNLVSGSPWSSEPIEGSRFSSSRGRLPPGAA